MRTSITVVLLAGIVTGAGAAPESLRPVQKIVIVALAKDAARAAAVEAGLKEDFAKRGIKADGLRALLSTTTLSTAEILDRLHADHYDSVLCLAPRKTIRITSSDKTSKISSLEACLNTFVTGKMPTGEPLDVNPVTADPLVQGTGMANTARTPIPTNSAAVAYTVSKGTLRLFRLPSGTLRWEAMVQVKLPTDIQTQLETQLIVREIAGTLEKSGVFPRP